MTRLTGEALIAKLRFDYFVAQCELFDADLAIRVAKVRQERRAQTNAEQGKVLARARLQALSKRLERLEQELETALVPPSLAPEQQQARVALHIESLAAEREDIETEQLMLVELSNPELLEQQRQAVTTRLRKYTRALRELEAIQAEVADAAADRAL